MKTTRTKPQNQSVCKPVRYVYVLNWGPLTVSPGFPPDKSSTDPAMKCCVLHHLKTEA